MQKTGIVRDQRFLNHITDRGHPERPERLETIYAMLDGPEMTGKFEQISPRRAEKKEILFVHSPEYFAKVARTAGRDHCALTPDTHTSKGSFDAAMVAAGGVIEAVTQVVNGDLDNAFALVRPPGHHAEKNRAMGYCLFNNVAIAAMVARKTLGLRRVLIADWDVHHGNGTQHCFETDPTVLFFSTHQFPYFPGTGLYTETGRGPGEGFTVNLPLPAGYGDNEMVAIYETLLRPMAMEFSPDLILVSVGFDLHQADPMGGMKVTSAGFAGLTRSLMDIAGDCCNGRLVLCLEGGYDLKSLAESVRAVLYELTGRTITSVADIAAGAHHRKLDFALTRSFHVHEKYWRCL